MYSTKKKDQFEYIDATGKYLKFYSEYFRFLIKNKIDESSLLQLTSLLLELAHKEFQGIENYNQTLDEWAYNYFIDLLDEIRKKILREQIPVFFIPSHGIF